MTLILGHGAIILEIGLECVVKQDSDMFISCYHLGVTRCYLRILL